MAGPTGNLLLDALPHDLYRSLEPHFERLRIRRGTVLHQPGRRIRHLHFPLSCLVSITITTREGKTAEAGVAGHREMVGVNAFMGGAETTQTRYAVQIPGEAIKIPAEPLRQAFDQYKPVRDIFLNYTQALIAQISQNAVCNRLHAVRPRYARWLLECRDRIQSDDLHLTQGFAAEMLGVRRASVTETSLAFEKEALIAVRRGLVRIVDGKGLQRAACECYGVLKSEYDRLLGGESPAERHVAAPSLVRWRTDRSVPRS